MLSAFAAPCLSSVVSVNGMQHLKRILKVMFRDAVLLGFTGIFVGAIVGGLVVWPESSFVPPLGIVYGFICGALVGALLSLFAFKPSDQNPTFEKRITLWKLLSENQRIACKVGLLVFGPGALFFILSGVLLYTASEGLFNMSRREILTVAAVSLLSICVACVLLVIRLHSTKKQGKS
jgi:hypothetical protein